jgi:hypothetical protein
VRIQVKTFQNLILKLETKRTLTRYCTVSGLISDESTFELRGDDPIRILLISMLEGELSNETSIIIPNMLPRFVAVRNRGVLSVVNQLQRTPGCKLINVETFF